MFNNDPTHSHFSKQRTGFMAAATFAGAGVVICGLIYLLVTYLAGAEFSQEFLYAALFALGALSGLTALGFSFIAQNATGSEKRLSAFPNGRDRRSVTHKAASAFLAIAYLCIIAVAVAAWFLTW
jgi:hypothetical protein